MTEATAESIEQADEESPTTQAREAVAELIAQLSMADDSPTTFELPDGPFISDAVDFDTDGWTRCVGQVQGWLRFSGPLANGSQMDFAIALASELGFAEPTEALERVDDCAALGLIALERLRERADIAIRHQRIFVEEFSTDGGTRESATRIWETAWEDDEEDEDVVSPDPVSAKADTWRIEQYVAVAAGGKLNLAPSYQRGDVWATSARQQLIESILRGIPLPSVILLKSDNPSSRHFEVVDGKQRLTSILRFVGKHPLALARVRQEAETHPELLELFSNDYPQFKREWKRIFNEPLTASLEERFYFPFKLRNDDRGLPGENLAPLRGKYYTQIKALLIDVADEQTPVEDVFEAWTEYKIPVIIYNRATQKQIHEVFNLYNRQGMHLNAEEIRNAIYNELELCRAILVSAGDSDPRTPVDEIAPSIEPGWAEIRELQATLKSYGFGESRYRRTKVLSWIIATLLMDSGERLPSTAKHIDALLTRVQVNKADPLRDGERICGLLEWIAGAAEEHSAYGEAWAPTFMDGDRGTKWQELQLVGSLVGIATAAVVLGDDLGPRLAESTSALRDASKTWIRPEKTQTRTQWEFISKVAREVVRLLGVDSAVAAEQVRERYGSSGIETLWAVAADDSAE